MGRFHCKISGAGVFNSSMQRWYLLEFKIILNCKRLRNIVFPLVIGNLKKSIKVQSSSSDGSNLISDRLTLKVRAQRSIETSVNIFQSTQYDIPKHYPSDPLWKPPIALCTLRYLLVAHSPRSITYATLWNVLNSVTLQKSLARIVLS
jgi:hypothetical protein